MVMGREANSCFGGRNRWQLERALYYEMAVVYGVFCGMFRFLSSYNRRKGGREGVCLEVMNRVLI